MSPLCLLSLLLAAAAPGANKNVWLLEQPNWQREEAALLEALLMYTRDLRVPITISLAPADADTAKADATEAPVAEAQTETARARCAADASLVLWFGGSKAAPSLSVYRCRESLESQMRLSPVDDLDLAAQTLALKLRGVIAQLSEEAANRRTTGRASARPPAPDDSAMLAESAPKPGGAASPAVWELGLSYSLLAANANSDLRQGATLRLGRSLARWPVALEADATFATSMVNGSEGYRVSVSDLPLGLSVSARWQGAHWLFAVGPRATLHYVTAHGSGPENRQGGSSRLAAGMGVLGQVRYQVWKSLAFGLAWSGDLALPRQRFTLDGGHAVDVGMWQLALAAGAVYSY